MTQKSAALIPQLIIYYCYGSGTEYKIIFHFLGVEGGMGKEAVKFRSMLSFQTQGLTWWKAIWEVNKKTAKF